MDLQSLSVFAIVAGALGYASWTLMPAAWRRALTRRVTGRMPVEAAGCGGCGGGCTPPPSRSASAAAETAVKPITFQRTPR